MEIKKSCVPTLLGRQHHIVKGNAVANAAGVLSGYGELEGVVAGGREVEGAEVKTRIGVCGSIFVEGRTDFVPLMASCMVPLSESFL